MKNPPLDILFISHDSYRGGATLFLLNIQKWIREHTDISFATILCKRGEMTTAFSDLGPVIKLAPTYQDQGKLGHLKQTLQPLAKRFVNTSNGLIELTNLVKQVHKIGIPRVIYSNTVVNGLVLEQLSILDSPVLTHVHELEHSIKKFAGDAFPKTLQYTHHYIAVSNAVRENLIGRHHIPPEKISLIYGFTPTALQPSNEAVFLKQLISQELGIPPSAHIIGCCGSIDWRKGRDILVHVAKLIPASCNDRPVHFIWVGGLPPENELYELLYDIEKSGIADRIHFVGSKSNPLDYIAIFDIFALLSREDPFPLVVMEAAALKIPTICFENSGGAGEFIGRDAGITVPYLDTKLYSEACLELLSNFSKRTTMGNIAMERVRQKHDIDKIVPQILQCAKNLPTSLPS